MFLDRCVTLPRGLASFLMTPDMPFQIAGALYPRSPVVIAVAHAGRDYPRELLDMARVPLAALRGLEDSFADALVGIAAGEGATTIAASIARAAIDLNRDPREIDPMMVDGLGDGRDLLSSQKVRGGLGLIPRRLATCGELWKHRLSAAEIDRRIARVHIPYHRAIADALAAAYAVYGAAVLIDCHSMPPLPPRSGSRARLILGDRFGKSAGRGVIDAAMTILAESGLPFGRNQPYAGGYTLERHGAPAANIHAVQIEFDRTLYMGAGAEPTREGAAACGRLLADLASELAGVVTRDNRDTAIAAE